MSLIQFKKAIDIEALQSRFKDLTHEMLEERTSFWLVSSKEVVKTILHACEQKEEKSLCYVLQSFQEGCLCLKLDEISDFCIQIERLAQEKKFSKIEEQLPEFARLIKAKKDILAKCLKKSSRERRKNFIMVQDFESMREMLSQSNSWLLSIGMAASNVARFEVCASEALTNIIQHSIAQSSINYRLSWEYVHIKAVISFKGNMIPHEVFCPDRAKLQLLESNKNFSSQGRGNFILHKWLESYFYSREGNTNNIHMIFKSNLCGST